MGKYFDPWISDSLIKQAEESPLLAINNMKIYLESYPFDYLLREYYARTLIDLGFFDEAKAHLDYIEFALHNDKKIRSKSGHDDLKASVVYDRIRILTYLNKLQEAYEMYQKNLHIIKGFKARFFNLFSYICDNVFNGVTYDREGMTLYLYKQFVYYDEKDFYGCEEKHINKEVNQNYVDCSIFNEDFPFQEVYEYIKSIVPTDPKLYRGPFQNQYYFKYDSNGINTSQIVDFIKVNTINGTNNILSMYPTICSPGKPFIDINDKFTRNRNK